MDSTTAEPSTALVSLTPEPRPLLGMSMRLALRAVTSLPARDDPALALAARHPGLRVHAVRMPVGDHHTEGTFFLPRGEGPRPCVLLLHGTSAWSPLAYVFFIAAMLEENLGVLCVDLDGHGRHPQPLTSEGLARTAQTALHWLARHELSEADRLGVMGVSLGGSCALRAAAASGRARALALVSTPVKVSMPRRARVRELLTTLNPEGLEGWDLVAPHALLRALRSAIRVGHFELAEGPCQVDLFHDWTEAIIRQAVDELDPLGMADRVRDLPVVLLNGAWDAIAPPDQARTLEERFTGPRERWVIPRRNHFTIMNSARGARRVAHWMARWLG